MGYTWAGWSRKFFHRKSQLMVPRQAVVARAVPAVMRINVLTVVVLREDLDHPQGHLPTLLAAHPAVHLVVVGEINEGAFL